MWGRSGAAAGASWHTAAAAPARAPSSASVLGRFRQWPELEDPVSCCPWHSSGVIARSARHGARLRGPLYHESDVRSSTIASLQEAEGGQDGLMDLFGRPATDVRSTVQEDFHQPDDARLVDLDAGIAHRADGDRQGDTLQERKVYVNVEPLGLEGLETAGEGLPFLPPAFEIVQALPSP